MWCDAPLLALPLPLPSLSHTLTELHVRQDAPSCPTPLLPALLSTLPPHAFCAPPMHFVPQAACRHDAPSFPMLTLRISLSHYAFLACRNDAAPDEPAYNGEGPRLDPHFTRGGINMGVNRRQPGCECSGRLQTLARSLSLSLPSPLICAHSFPPTLSPPWPRTNTCTTQSSSPPPPEDDSPLPLSSSLASHQTSDVPPPPHVVG